MQWTIKKTKLFVCLLPLFCDRVPMGRTHYYQHKNDNFDDLIMAPLVGTVSFIIFLPVVAIVLIPVSLFLLYRIAKAFAVRFLCCCCT